MRSFATSILILLTASVFAAAETPQLQQLRDQLKKAQNAEDKPAIIELSRRIVAITPKDSGTWNTLAQTQFESEELDDLERTLDAWQKITKRPSAPIEDFRAEICFKRKDYQCAEQHWLAFLATKPPRSDMATGYDNLAEVCAEQARWTEHAAYRSKAIAAQDTAARRVLRATAFLRLRNWDAAYADMTKANKMDATNPQVKEWLPQFEQLQKFLPQIKPLDAQIAKSPDDIALLLERARVFILAGRPLLAIDDAERAFKLQTASMRARIELAEAFLDAGRPEDAAKLQVDRYLRRGEDKQVSGEALRELGMLDARLSANPKDADALGERAKILRELRQFTLALADANAALAVNDKSAAAHFEAARDLDRLNRQKEALLRARMATDLDPQNPEMWFFRGVLERQRADFAGAVSSQTRSIDIDESLVALNEREQCERRIGKTAEADADLRRIEELKQ
ncbi:MAG: tetratricopeptide repeat protein [Candidatus Udaeobacter sp.]